ncbi:MAG: hypothetical protein JXA15_08425 [Spirochaetales bacterium]|nr:hypothetical protein [Spirochaetales bacterium]
MIPTILLAAYGAVLIGIALASLKYSHSIENFLVAGRKQRKLFVVASMLASTIGGGITIGTVSKAVNMGFPAFWFVAAGGIAHFLQGIFLSRKVRESEALTMPDLAGGFLGPRNRLLVSVIIVITWTGLAAAQFVAAAKVITTLTGLGHQDAVAIAAGFLIIYTLIGGQKSVLRTDLFQFGLLALALIASLAWLFLARPPAPGALEIELFNASFQPLDLVYYVVVVGGSYLICPMMFSRVLSSDSPANARRSSFISGAGMFVFAFAITFVGLWARASGLEAGGLDPLNAIAANVLPSALGVALVMGLLAAILSTGDTVLMTAASVFEHDVLKRDRVGGVRFWIVAVGFVAAFVALFSTDIIGLILKTYNGYTAGIVPVLFVALVVGKGRKMNPALAFAGIAIGYALGTAGSFQAAASPWAKLFPMLGLAASAALALAAAYVKPSLKNT